MIEEQDLQQAFSHLLLVGNLLAIPGDAAQKRINEIFDRYGFSIIHSGYEVIDKCRIGDSSVTIARYSVECRRTDREQGRPFVVEGAIAFEEDEWGNLNISVSTKSRLFPHVCDTMPAKGSSIDRNIPTVGQHISSLCIDSK